MSRPDLDLTRDACVIPEWPAAPGVHAFFSTRRDGVSQPPYGAWRDGVEIAGGLNLGQHTGDAPADVAANRARLLALAGQTEAAWLDQVHGTTIARAEQVLADYRRHPGMAPVQADACVTDVPDSVCVVMVADCLPVLLRDRAGRAVGAAHAGWRGLVAGIVEQTALQVAALAGQDGDALDAWLGPAIGPEAFEVGAEVREAFLDVALQHEKDATDQFFVARADAPGKYFGNLYGLARLRLARVGTHRISGGKACTYSEPERFYSYRRDRITGRQAALIWLADQP
jgi:polyphenol oxidase